ncbi:MAG: type III-B CRISPR-associated protein Cas10/Cmr2, partial [Candidatus Omnitrophica bacterium]|nr:type III-B CRISPR-associated protein Cas10/Cmr2 [Candidatus Omnitrophota bacterium]
MKEETVKKLKAFLHDPIDKAFNIQFHRMKAQEYAQIFDIHDIEDEDTKKADHISSAADRITFQKEVSVNFNKQAELTHPLGSGRVKLTGPEYGFLSPAYEEVENLLKIVFNELKNESSGQPKLPLLTLWRNLTEKLRDFELKKFKLGNLWNLLPADTRIPDHSILDHCWLSSAIAGSLPDPAFLKFSFGPVQNFVLASKRTEDYWAASYILSYLCSRAIEVIIEKFGPEHIIFPYLHGQPLIDLCFQKKYSIPYQNPYSIKTPSLSNIIFALLPNSQAKETAEKMKTTIHLVFEEIGDSIKKQFHEFLHDQQIEQIWQEQVDGFFEVYYSIYPWPIDTSKVIENYELVCGKKPDVEEGVFKNNHGNYWMPMYKILDLAFNSRKNLRNFWQIQIKSNLSKCSMCGEREVLAKNGIKNQKELREFWGRIGKSQQSYFKIDKDGRDRLCAICFIKRMAGEHYFRDKVFNNKSETYPSTGTIAALSFKLNLLGFHNNPEIVCKVDQYNKLLGNIGIKGTFNWRDIELLRNSLDKIKDNAIRNIFDEFFSIDGHWVYIESFKEKSLMEQGIIATNHKDIINKIKKLLNEIYELANDSPSKYYAIISMDGDRMGKWLSGTHENWPLWKDVLHSEAIPAVDPNIIDKKRNLSPSIHSFISKTVSYFSLILVRDIVEKQFPGKLVYSGGDDVLAFVPIDVALSVSEKIRFTFSGNI